MSFFEKSELIVGNIYSNMAELDKSLEGLTELINAHAGEGNSEAVKVVTKQLQKNQSDFLTFKEGLESFFNGIVNDYLEKTEEVVYRTSWSKDNGAVRVVTDRHLQYNNPYINIIPIPLFKDIVKTALDKIENQYQSEVRIGWLFEQLKVKIVNESEYKKSPSTLLSKVFVVLRKEGLLERVEQGVYRFLVSPEEVKAWLSELDKVEAR